MSRYIDADELIFFGFDNPDDDNLFEFVPKEFIDNAPTADVVEVIRCKDCENWDRHWISSLFSENVHYCAFIDGPCNGDFYCAAAIKRHVLGGDKH